MAHGEASATRLVIVAGTILTILFVAIVSRAFYGREQTDSAARKPTSPLAQAPTSVSDLEKDTDNDGLADWEEILWNSDPKKTDTDGDGRTDGEEARQGNDPTVVGVGNLAGARDIAASTTALALDNPTNATQALSRELFSTYMQSLQKDPQHKLTEEEQDAMTDKALATAKQYLTAPLYEMKDVHTVPATPENRATYLYAFTIGIDALIKGVPNEFDALSRFVNGDRESAVRDLKKAYQLYSERAEIFKNLSVPADAIEYHLQFMNGLLAYLHDLDSFAQYENDPIRAAVSVNTFLDNSALMLVGYRHIAEYARTHEIARTTNP